MLLKDIETYVKKNAITDDGDLMSDSKYICKSCSLITESLQKGCDVMQLPNGDIVVTELKPVTFYYTWDAKKETLVRNQPGNKTKKTKARKKIANTYEEQTAEIEEIA